MVKIEIEGKEYQLHYGILEQEKMEDYHGCGLGEIFKEQNLGIKTLITSLWAGMIRFQPEFAPIKAREKVAMMLDTYQKQGNDMKVIGKAINDALVESGLLGNVTGETSKN